MVPSATAIIPTTGFAGAPVCGDSFATPSTSSSASGSFAALPLIANLPVL